MFVTGRNSAEDDKDLEDTVGGDDIAGVEARGYGEQYCDEKGRIWVN